MVTHKAPVSIEQAKCAPCSGLVCVGVCPQGILELDLNKKPHVVDPSACNCCEVCANLCPTKAITVTRFKPSK